MSAVQRLPTADPLYAQPSPDRPHYTTGMLLDAQDFLDEQTYHRSRLARALAFVSGGGTLAGLRVEHRQADAATDRAEEIRVSPGLAVDRLGRLIEVPRPACLRLGAWFAARLAEDGGDLLRRSSYDAPTPFLSARAVATAGTGDFPAVPMRATVADLYLRFIACERGLTPSFASGPFDALDAVSSSRLRDAYELRLELREGLEAGFLGLPSPGPDLAAIGDTDARRSALQDAILDGWPATGRSGGTGGLDPLAEHPRDLDPSAVFLARVLVPVTADLPPQRDGTAVLVDNWSRRFAPGLGLLSRWIGA